MGKDFLKKGKNVSLRDAHLSDCRAYINWMHKGEWKDFDAPWEEFDNLSKKELRKRFEQLFLKEKVKPRKRAIMTLPEDKPIGWVNRYHDNEHDSLFLIGIDICEDDHLDAGLGTEALELWINYLFENSDVHKVGLHTYSFNHRMNKVAKRLGFKKEGVDREVIRWKGEWINRIRYGMLRHEWNEMRGHSLR